SAEVGERLAEASGRARRARRRVDPDYRRGRDRFAAAEQVGAAARERGAGVVRRDRQAAGGAQPRGRAEQNLRGRAAADEAAEREDPSARERDRGQLRDRLRQAPDPLDLYVEREPAATGL